MTEIVTVDFHGDRLFVFEQNGVQYVAMKPIVEALGLDWHGQRQRIHRDEVLSEGAVMMPSPSNGGTQDALCLPLHLLNGWLFGVDAARVRPELREKITLYRRECFQALADHFGVEADEPMVPMGTYNSLTLQERRQLVNEARVTFCRRSAQELWIELGLPTTPSMLDRGRPRASPGDSRDRVLAVIRERPRITRRELMQKFQSLKSANLDTVLQGLASDGLVRESEHRRPSGGVATRTYEALSH